MEPTPNEIQEFINTFGYNDLNEINEAEEFPEMNEEVAIDMNYEYSEFFKKYFKRNNILYTSRDEEILEYLIQL